jgi:hypothetical protein
MKFLTLKHLTNGIHQLGISISHEGKAQVSLDGADAVTPKIGMGVDWGDGVKSPSVTLCFDWNERKGTGDIRVVLFDGWLCEGRNYAILDKLSAEPAPQPAYVGMEDHHDMGSRARASGG